MKKKLFTVLLGAVICMGAMAQVTPYGWRGPEHNGNYPDKGLLSQWPEAGPELVFETEDAGKGYSSPLVVGDRVYITGLNEDGTKEVFQCYTLDGKKQYTVEYGNPWKQSYPETRTTPAIMDGKAYVISGMAEIVCIDIKDGNTLTEQITLDEQQEKLRKQIVALEAKMRKEKQPRKKLELHQQIINLKKKKI